MRFEVAAGFAIGILLPVLETCRRGFGHWAVSTMTMLEDYAAGGLLLFAAILSTRRVRTAPLLQLVAWSCVTAMMTVSTFHHLEATLRSAPTEPHIAAVFVIKFLLLATSLIALVFSFRRARSVLLGVTSS